VDDLSTSFSGRRGNRASPQFKALSSRHRAAFLLEFQMTLTPQQRDTLCRIRANVQRKLDLATTSIAYRKGTNANTCYELRKQIEALTTVIGY